MALDLETYPQSQVTTPAGNGAFVTPNDSIDLEDFSRELYVGIGGNIKVTFAANEEVVTLVGVPGGSRLPYVVKRVWATDTTASSIVAVW